MPVLPVNAISTLGQKKFIFQRRCFFMRRSSPTEAQSTALNERIEEPAPACRLPTCTFTTRAASNMSCSRERAKQTGGQQQSWHRRPADRSWAAFRLQQSKTVADQRRTLRRYRRGLPLDSAFLGCSMFGSLPLGRSTEYHTWWKDSHLRQKRQQRSKTQGGSAAKG